MRPVAALGIFSALLVLAGCTDNPCEDKTGRTTCGYCAQDRVMTDNPHAGMCRYCGSDGTYCAGSICGDDLKCVTKAFLSIPKATFHKGSPPTPSSSASAPRIKTVSPLSQSVALNSSVTWTVEWEVTVEVTAIIYEVSTLQGYYEIPVTTEESDLGSAQVQLSEATAAPGASGCIGPTTCWEEAPHGTTTGDGSFSLVGGGEVGQPLGGAGLSWEVQESQQSSNNTTVDGCPTAAQLGCCTTSGGIQVLGAAIPAGCGCPGGTCPMGTNFCGCQACGGCN